MQKQIMQNHPRGEGRGLWAHIHDYPSKNRLGDFSVKRCRPIQVYSVSQPFGADRYRRMQLRPGILGKRLPLWGIAYRRSNAYADFCSTKTIEYSLTETDYIQAVLCPMNQEFCQTA